MNHYLYYDLSKIFIGSQNAGLLVTPIISKNRLGSRAFSYWAPLLWNQLSPWVREADPPPSPFAPCSLALASRSLSVFPYSPQLHPQSEPTAIFPLGFPGSFYSVDVRV